MRVEWTFLVTLGLALWCACCSTGCDPVAEGRATDRMNVGMYHFSKTEFCGHSYVVFSYDRGGGIAHDPDCTCGWLGRRRD